jgi:hypothetical protein
LKKQMSIYYSKAEIEEIGEAIISRYLGSRSPQRCIDIEGFIREYLHAEIQYEYFSEDDVDKIGFLADGRTPLQVIRNRQPKTIVFPIDTVVIDRLLLQGRNSARRRFTLAHEAAHIILNRSYNNVPSHGYNRVFDPEQNYTADELRAILNMGESQADNLAAVLLMPQSNVRSIFDEFVKGHTITLYGRNSLKPTDKMLIREMADEMGVSYTALKIRLRNLNYFEFRSIDEFITEQFGIGGGL